MTLGFRIRTLLSEKGITQRELADALHLSPSTINGYLQDRRIPDSITLSRIASFLHTNVNCLLDNYMFRSPSESSLTIEETFLLSNYRGMDVAHQRMLLEISESFYQYNQKNSAKQS